MRPSEFNTAEINPELVPEKETANGSPSKSYNTPKVYDRVCELADMSRLMLLGRGSRNSGSKLFGT